MAFVLFITSRPNVFSLALRADCHGSAMEELCVFDQRV